MLRATLTDPLKIRGALSARNPHGDDRACSQDTACCEAVAPSLGDQRDVLFPATLTFR